MSNESRLNRIKAQTDLMYSLRMQARWALCMRFSSKIYRSTLTDGEVEDVLNTLYDVVKKDYSQNR